MDELPDLVVDAMGDERVVESVAIGGDDAVVVTAPRTYVYRSEGLLSDESVETYDHDVEGFGVSEGRRKTTLRLAGVDGEQSLTVPSKHGDRVLEAVLEGILRTGGAVEADETIEATFRFSELTLVVTEARLLKHVGSAVWDREYESFPHEDLTGLDFEQGSVATQVVVETDGRPQRVKVPNEHAGRVREEVQSAVFEYHDVSSLGGLREAVGPDDEDEDDEADEDDAGESPAEDAGPAAAGTPETDAGESGAGGEDGFVPATSSPPADQDVTGPRESGSTAEAVDATDGGDGGIDVPSLDADDGNAARNATEGPDGDLAARLDELAATVERQTELLEAQQETIAQLVDELRRGR